MRAKLWQMGLLILLAIVVLITTSKLMATRFESSGSPLLVAAAASLQPALREITPLYTQAYPRQAVDYNFAASGALQQQIAQGAPIDIFISAADKQMNALQTQGLLAAGTPQTLLTNQLVLVIPKPARVSVNSFRQLTEPAVRRIAIGETRTVPAGEYAAEVLQHLGIFDRVKSKFVLGNNVRAVLSAVESGDVEAGIVYLTDARGSAKITIAAIADRQWHQPIHYPIAILKQTKSLAAARQYVKFLHSNSATAIFKKYGFGIDRS
jgi:molybdate transport system substrate-binding protein